MTISAFDPTTLGDTLGLEGVTSISTSGDSSMFGISDSSLASFSPIDSDGFLVLSTGLASDVTQSNSSGDQGTDIGEPGEVGDTATLTFQIEVPDNADYFGFTFTFLSEEYPEYVGSIYNDFFSMTVNGTELALDTNGNPISVNNDFFSDTLTPLGTQFDGQTPVLGVHTAVHGTDTLTIEMSIADEGDGIYDSAAFIGNFTFHKTQIVYVNFDGGSIDYTIPGVNNSGLTLAGSGISSAVQAAVIAQLQQIYADFAVEFTTTEPTSGEYSTVLVGGQFTDLPQWIQDNKNDSILGTVSAIDNGNNDRSDDSFVLAGEINSDASWTAAQIEQLAQVIAHESGHLFGLHHVDELGGLMYPYAGAGNTDISNDEELFHATSGEQDTYDLLGTNLGFSGSQVLVDTTSFLQDFLNFFGFTLNSTGATPNALGDPIVIHDAVAVIYEVIEGTVIPVEIIELGEFSGDFDANFVASALEEHRVTILGASEPGGETDVFLSDGSVTEIDPANMSMDEILIALGVPASEIATADLSMGQIGSDGQITEIAGVTGVIADASNSTATEGNDSLPGTENDDVLFGLGGDDTMAGEDGDDNLIGGNDDDQIEGGPGSDTVSGGGGDDDINGGTGADFITGGGGNDTINGWTAFDALSGGSGDDSIIGGIGADSLYGNDGDDTLLSNTGVDLISGGDGNDWISSGNGADVVDGGSGDDFIIGRTGEDSINGGSGNDSLYGSAGIDTILGGLGDDYISAGSAWDLIYGNSGDDTLEGNYGSDYVSGGSGDDSLLGGTGDDTLIGGAGNDTILGNQGRDVISGGAGDDLLRGGTLADEFHFTAGGGEDTIEDFENGQDTLHIDASIVGGLTNGQDIVDTYGSVLGTNTVLVFDDGTSVILQGETDLTALYDNVFGV